MNPKSKKTITLFTGGSRSGKSSQALEEALKYNSPLFLATAEAFDPEMKERIQNHQLERSDNFATLEEPLTLASAILENGPQYDVILVDCLTVWIGNMMHHYAVTPDKHVLDKQGFDKQDAETSAFLQVLANPPCHLILVTNEVGMGIIPENALSRKFKDLAGRLNQDVAKLADQVTLMVSGLPLNLKETKYHE